MLTDAQQTVAMAVYVDSLKAPEPQTAAYQAAVDDVWFENSRNASSIRASWNWKGEALRSGRWDYLWELQEAMARALNVRKLDYELDND